ncbi:hypothetical protein LEP3755_23590 [Leptolyngbya sp. NIES-3755]|nr:hypothetical protein LEP3755_23590 [Leptolyngbya sp. NIES-3755]
MFHSSSNSVKRSPVWMAALVGSIVTAQGFFGLASRPLNTAQFSEPRSIQVESPESDNRSTAAIALAALGLGAIGYGWSQSRKPSGTQVNRGQLDQQLLLLMHQDRAAAERLIAQMQRKHPEKSRQWCIEKVKYDLQRDRH